ncbi:MAG: hypothetical protein MJ237_05350 [bacterium]|nr:hypothetical protein [bacterium]
MNNICDNLFLIILLPLWIFLIIMAGRFFAVYVNKYVIYILTLLSSFSGSLLCGYMLTTMPIDSIYENQIPFIKINDFLISAGIYVDRAALIFALTLYTVSFLIQIFSIYYMNNDKKKYRFFALLNLFNFTLSGLIFSPNMYQMYVFWELVGLTSYLLIGFEYSKPEKSLASKKVFIINRIGDTVLLTGIIICSYLMYSYSPSKSLTTLSFMDMNTISSFVYAYTPDILFLFVCILFIIAAAVKSAQFPFYTWLQDAMEAKLPVSSLLHSATLVSLGIYLILRTSYFYTLSGITLKIIAITGLLTAIICSFSALVQNNPKKVLAYSTSAQLGLIFYALGVLNFKVAIIMFISHAITKSMLFVTLPDNNQKWSYVKLGLFILGGLSLSGIILSGYISKSFLCISDYDISRSIILFISILTAVYITRIAILIVQKNGLEKLNFNAFEIMPSVGLILLNISFFIYLQVNYKVPFYYNSFIVLFFVLLTLLICIKIKLPRISYVYDILSRGFYLDTFYTTVITKSYGKIAELCDFVDKKLFSEYGIIITISKFLIKLFGFVEKNIINKIVDLIIRAARWTSKSDLKVQSGNIQKYNFYAFILLSVAVFVMVIAYTAILEYIGKIN